MARIAPLTFTTSRDFVHRDLDKVTHEVEISIPLWAFPHFSMLTARVTPGSIPLFANINPQHDWDGSKETHDMYR